MSVAVTSSRREAAFAAVEAYNRAHPKARLPRPADRLLATMFADRDVCCPSQSAAAARPGSRPPVSSKAHSSARLPRVAPDLYPALGAVFRSALISFCAQISAAPATGSVLPGIVSQPPFTSMSPR